MDKTTVKNQTDQDGKSTQESNEEQATLQSIMKKLNGMDTTINSKIDSMKTDIDSMKTDIDSMKTDIDSMKTDINRLNITCGKTNERILRKEIAKKYGENFAKPFNCHGLNGIVRLIRMKKTHYPTTNIVRKDERDNRLNKPKSDRHAEKELLKKLIKTIEFTLFPKVLFKHYLNKSTELEKVQSYEELSNYILQCNQANNIQNKKKYHSPEYVTSTIKKIQLLQNDLEIMETKEQNKCKINAHKTVEKLEFIKRILILYRYFLEAKNEEEEYDCLLQDDSFGLLAWSSTFGEPIHELEFDCRGDCNLMYDQKMYHIHVRLGEIKSKCISGAKSQIKKRIKVLGQAISQVYGEDGRISFDTFIFNNEDLKTYPRQNTYEDENVNDSNNNGNSDNNTTNDDLKYLILYKYILL